MSTYRDDSQLSQFNRAPAGEWFPVSSETAYLVSEAIRYHRLTEGALDITVGPVSRLWQFGLGADGPGQAFKPPSDDEVQRVKALVGAHHLSVRLEPPALRKDTDGVEIDVSALAPGYAVDLVVNLLASLGYANAMVEIGGEVRAAGSRPDGKPWRIGVERAGSIANGLVAIVPLENCALTTAGDYRNFREYEGIRVTHIIDPQGGRPLAYQGVSVTVLADTALEADALDTALLVMGAERGYEWCVENELAALFQSGGGREAGVRSTPKFSELAPETMPAASMRAPATAPTVTTNAHGRTAE
jgi:FAD:protein FMN transferase